MGRTPAKTQKKSPLGCRIDTARAWIVNEGGFSGRVSVSDDAFTID